MVSFSAGLRYSAPEIRSLALYPDELRARTRLSAVSGSFTAAVRQRLNGTGRQRAAHSGTMGAHYVSHKMGRMTLLRHPARTKRWSRSMNKKPRYTMAEMQVCADATDFPEPVVDPLRRGVEAYGQHVVDFLGHDKPWGRLGRVSIRKFDAAENCVYFIGGETGPIKIGSSVSPLYRFATFQTGSPVVLRIHALCAGGLAQERSYQKQFAKHRLHGEWFAPHPDILAEIARLSPQAARGDG